MNHFTHKQLVQIAYRWVLANGSCGVAFKELKALTGIVAETADVIGFGAWEHSVLIEVKVTRTDFLSDKKKHFRKFPETGLGKKRYYCCPAGLIKKEELPAGWGLIYVNEKGKARMEYSPSPVWNRSDGDFVSNLSAERAIMYSALRRLQLRGRVDEIYEPHP